MQTVNCKLWWDERSLRCGPDPVCKQAHTQTRERCMEEATFIFLSVERTNIHPVLIGPQQCSLVLSGQRWKKECVSVRGVGGQNHGIKSDGGRDRKWRARKLKEKGDSEHPGWMDWGLHGMDSFDKSAALAGALGLIMHGKFRWINEWSLQLKMTWVRHPKKCGRSQKEPLRWRQTYFKKTKQREEKNICIKKTWAARTAWGQCWISV